MRASFVDLYAFDFVGLPLKSFYLTVIVRGPIRRRRSSRNKAAQKEQGNQKFHS